MPTVHEVIGYAIVGGWAVLMLWALTAWIVKRDPGQWFWRLLAVLQVSIAVQLVAGLILIAIYGFRAKPLLHYGYGAVFPIIVLVLAHVLARDLERDQWKVFGLAAFVCFGLTLRALATGLGIG